MSAPVVPLFPLPNVLLYPGAVLPLHVFEPRYVELVEDMNAAGLDQIALALLQPGWKDLYFEEPPFYEIGGLGRLISTQPAQDGRYNILLEG
jgi:Lon protease-like protein